MKILPVAMFSQAKPYEKEQPLNKQQGFTQPQHQNYTTIVPLYNDYLLSFGARVDKGLDRFYEVNKEIMPQRVREHIESLEDKSLETPLEAQQKAYEFLYDAETLEDIKGYKEFKGLKDATESRATSGILYDIREFSDLLAVDGKGVLKNKQNFTLYLVQKIYLENQTLDEINKALEEDLEPDFKDAFKYNNEDARFIHPSTLDSLGIKAPSREYRQSLRYTREGYSDLMGEKISGFWNSLSDTERTARAKKSVLNFENWWASIPHDKQLDMLMAQEAELSMLELYKKAHGQRTTATPKAQTSETPAATAPKTKPVTKVGSAKLSQDELFIKWATNTLKIAQEKLTDADRDAIQVKRTRAQMERWGSMSAAERTTFISKLKSGQEPLKYTMIDAWNHSFDIIKDLSEHLHEKHIERGIESIYAPEPFSEFQSRVMTEFWEAHPEHAEHLGEAIRNADARVKDAINNGRFESLKQEILRERSSRIKMLKAMKIKPPVTPEPVPETYMDEFKRVYYSTPETASNCKNLPKSYMRDYFKVIEENFDEQSIRAWTKNLKGERLTQEELELLRHIRNTEPEGAARINRALEATLGNVLYENTGNPEVYRLTFSDMKVALAQIDRKEPNIDIYSHNLDTRFQTAVKKHRINRDKIEAMYNAFIKPLKESELERIAHGFFRYNHEEMLFFDPVFEETRLDVTQEVKAVKKYIATYGQSANIIFSPKSGYSDDIRSMMTLKFLDSMPQGANCALADSAALLRENGVQRCIAALNNRFTFIPRPIMEVYNEETARSIRNGVSDFFKIEEFIKRVGKKRTSAAESSSIAVLPKECLSLANRFKILSAEQILAERLFDSTGNPSVFALHFEELCDKLEVLNLIKKYPNDSTLDFTSFDNGTVSLKPQKRPDLRDIAGEFMTCFEDLMAGFKKDAAHDGLCGLKTLVETLANGETNPQILKAIEQRIGHYKLPLRI